MENKKFFYTTLTEKLLKRFKMLAVKEDKRLNQLLEEAIRDILDKYKGK